MCDPIVPPTFLFPKGSTLLPYAGVPGTYPGSPFYRISFFPVSFATNRATCGSISAFPRPLERNFPPLQCRVCFLFFSGVEKSVTFFPIKNVSLLFPFLPAGCFLFFESFCLSARLISALLFFSDLFTGLRSIAILFSRDSPFECKHFPFFFFLGFRSRCTLLFDLFLSRPLCDDSSFLFFKDSCGRSRSLFPFSDKSRCFSLVCPIGSRSNRLPFFS